MSHGFAVRFLHFFLALTLASSSVSAAQPSVRSIHTSNVVAAVAGEPHVVPTAAQKTRLLRSTVDALNGYSSAADLIEWLKRTSDRDYLLGRLGESANNPVRVQFVAPYSLQVRFGGEQVNVDLKNIGDLRLSILKKDFAFDPSESAEAAVQRLTKLIAANSSTFGPILEPRAHALGWGIAIALYLSVAMTVGVECVKAKVNSVGMCAGIGFFWGIEAIGAGLALVMVGLQKEKLYFGATKFNLTELTCPQPGQPLVATVMDADDHPLRLEVTYNAKGEPEKIEYRNAKAQSQSLFIKAGWLMDDEKMPNAKSVDAWEFEMAVRGARQLHRACADGDARGAIERYMKKRTGSTPLAPRVGPDGVTIKTVE